MKIGGKWNKMGQKQSKKSLSKKYVKASALIFLAVLMGTQKTERIFDPKKFHSHRKQNANFTKKGSS